MNPNKITLFFTIAFSAITIFAIGMDFIYPEGFNSTPKINEHNIRDGSVRSHGHGGFRFGK